MTTGKLGPCSRCGLVWAGEPDLCCPENHSLTEFTLRHPHISTVIHRQNPPPVHQSTYGRGREADTLHCVEKFLTFFISLDSGSQTPYPIHITTECPVTSITTILLKFDQGLIRIGISRCAYVKLCSEFTWFHTYRKSPICL
jgi:hypothetical protein